MARSVFRVEQGIQIKHARKYRAVLLPQGLDKTPVAIDDWWYPLRLSAVLGGGAITRHWSRYWPLTAGYVLEEGPEAGKAYNPLATMFIDLPEGVEAVYGPSILIGYDPTRREYCSVADVVLPTIVAARDELLQTVSTRS
jgi:hypothetical protein